MKTLIIYHSTYRKNTEKIAQMFAEKYGFELIDIKNAVNVNVSDYDLIGFGSGVYKENLSPKLFKLVESLDLKDKNVFVFSTSGVGMKLYNSKLIRLLESKGAINKGSFACKGSFTASDFSDKKIFDVFGKLSQGHPNDKDFRNAEKFIKSIL
ncbi:flavodoxin domain-containing protein [Lutispora thermophila]|uniref:Flavodoxin n=1 Tax=Lutispora thermophila DSM 19022 TaxID=1122184 RepID=A0A1M6D0N9_9FIRM|nr:flavodoxin domain-containing protein [Lutispora thermophila]SHI66885.1 Flavodoxin [Lutispora thermophila DSM 19022]